MKPASGRDAGGRVALVWVPAEPLRSITVRYERYVRGFRRLGWEAITICLPAAADGYAEPVVVAPTTAALRDPEFYRSLGCEVGVAITWLGLPDVVRAMKQAIPRVVSVSDSDGRIGARVHPAATLARGVHEQPTWGMRARAVKFWLQQWLFGGGKFDADVMESTTAADRVTVTSPAAAAYLRRYFGHHRRPDLAGKVAVAPYPVDDDFLTRPVPPVGERVNRVVAIGRWDDPQKDARLLADGVAWAAARSPGTEFVVVGRNGDAVTHHCQRVRDLGVQPPEVVAELMRTSRVLLVSSRWESGPIVAFEAVCSGATVVGPAWVPACRWLAPDGGRCFSRRSASSVGAAVVSELREWDAGHRDPAAVAAQWRPWFDPAEVCRRMLPPKGAGR